MEKPKWIVSEENNRPAEVIFNALRLARNNLGRSENCPEHGKNDNVCGKDSCESGNV